MVVDSEMRKIISLLRKSEVDEAARRFAKVMGLAYNERKKEGVEPPTGSSSKALEAWLKSPRLGDVDWWKIVAEEWLNSGLSELALMCTERARQMIEEGVPVSWDVLDSLSLLSMRASLSHSQTKSLSASLSKAALNREPRSHKESRIKLLFGKGTQADVQKHIENLARSGDWRGLLYCMTTSKPEVIKPYALPRLWFRLKEYRAAVEEFIALVAGHAIKDWLPHSLEALIFCGRSLYHLGDHISAYACLYLALCNVEQESKERRDNREQREKKEQDNPLIVMARDIFKRLDWARAWLDSGLDLCSLFTNGTRAGYWMAENDFLSRLPNYLKRYKGIARVCRKDVLGRQMKLIGERWGWVITDHLPVTLDGDDEDAEESYSNLEYPAVLPLDYALYSHGSDGPIIREKRRDISGRSYLDLSRFRSPGELRESLDVLSPHAVHVHVGYSCSGKADDGHLRVQPGRPILAISPAVDDRFLYAISRQMVAAGWRVLWIRRNDESKSTGVFDIPDENWGKIIQSNSLGEESRQWLRDMATSNSVREDITGCLLRATPGCSDPAISDCFKALVEKAHDSEMWDLLSEDSAKRRKNYACELVSEAASLGFHCLRDVRRVASLIDHTARALEALRSALQLNWSFPMDRDASEYGNVSGVLVGISSQPQLVSALTSLLCIGSLLHTVNACDQVFKEDSHDFDMNIREKSDRTKASPDQLGLQESTQESTEAVESRRRREIERLIRLEKEETGRRDLHRLYKVLLRRWESSELGKTPWREYRVISPDEENQFCIILSGDWGLEWSFLRDWLDLGGIGENHCLIAGLKQAPRSLLRHSDLNGFRTFLLGDILADDLELFEIAAGISVRSALVDAKLGQRGVVHIQEHENRTQKAQIVIWPKVEENLG